MRVVDMTLYRRLGERLRRLYGEEALARLLERFDLLAGRYGVGTRPDEHCGERLWSERDAVLIAYGDMVSTQGEPPLRTLRSFTGRHLGDAFSALHLLPFFPSSSDDGFAVMDYRQVDPALGGWEDVNALAEDFRLMTDLVLNHVSSQGVWFRNYRNGIAPERHYFIEADPDTDLSAVVRPRTSPLLRPVQTPYGQRHVWATFSHDQVDLDFRNPDVLFEILDILLLHIRHGARIIRLDAVAYLWKEIGTDCIHRPETHEVVKLLRDLLGMLAPGVMLIAETNVPHRENLSYFGDRDEAHAVYQFSLPPLLLHALETGESRHLACWVAELEAPPRGCTYLNFTASHDGIGLRPLEGILEDEQIEDLVARMAAKGGLVSRRAGPQGAEIPYELNITYYDALGFPGRSGSDLGVARFLCSQTLMLGLQGIPAVWFNSLLGAGNWLAGVKETGRARTINRRKWGEAELDALVADPARAGGRVLQEYLRRLRIRAEHPAFHPDGPQHLLDLPAGLFGVWRGAPDESESIWALANLTADPVRVSTGRIDARFRARTWRDLLAGWTAPGADLTELELAPYQVLWLRPEDG